MRARAIASDGKSAHAPRTASPKYTSPMEPNRFGRKLGIGVRVASRMAKERAAQAKAASANPSAAPQ